MKPFLLILCLLAMALGQNTVSAENAALDKAFKAFWEAGSAASRGRAVKTILKIDPTFDEVYVHLKTGRDYPAKVKHGRLSKGRMGPRSLRHPYIIYVPLSYDPSRSYPAAFYLHGGIDRPPPLKTDWWWGFTQQLQKENRIAVFPVSWLDSKWWQYIQVENLNAILDQLKQDYNIDENRVYLVGISDGGTGVYYQAFKNTTPWAAFLPIIGSPAVLNNPQSGVDGEIYAVNLSGKPFLAINGSLDPLYPVEKVNPYVELFRAAGCDIRLQPKQGYGHTINWWAEEEKNIESFIDQHHRDPYPDRLTWETEDTERSGRAYWLVITRLGAVAGESQVNPWNVIGFNENGGRMRQAFTRKLPSGRVALQKEGNRVDVFTQGVKEFKLLISPGDFDFQQPVKVFTNGVPVFSGRLTGDPAVLLKWAALDNDRTMLFGAELTITVPGR